MSLSLPHTPASSLTFAPSLIDVGGAEIAFHKIGAGPPLLLLHGWPLHGATFRHLLPALASRYTCYTIDFPGAGASRWSHRSPFDMAGQAEAVKVFAERIGLRSYAIVAHDTGGTIARQLAVIDERRVTKLVAIGTEIPHHRPPYIRLFQLVSYLPGADRGFLANMRSRSFLRSPRGFGGCFADLELIHGEFHRLFVQPLLESAELRLGQRHRLRGIDWNLLDGLAEGHGRIQLVLEFVSRHKEVAVTVMARGLEEPSLFAPGFALLQERVARAVEVGALRVPADEATAVLWSAVQGLVVATVASPQGTGAPRAVRERVFDAVFAVI